MRYASGAEQLTLWPEVSPASPTRLQEAARGERTSVTCGPSSHGWCERFDPDGCWLRTSLASALQQRTRCSLIWTRRATPAGRSWWVLTTLERPTEGSGCGSLATPRVSVLDGHATPMDCPSHGWDLPAQTKHWATATSRDWRSGCASAETHAKNSRPLSQATWHTPQAQDCEQAGSANRPALTHQTRLSCEAGPPDPESSNGSGRLRDWPTVQARDHKGPAPQGHTKGGRDLTSEAGARTRGSLNPAWVSQLMGLPDGWLDSDLPPDVLGLRRSATGSSRKSSRKSAEPSSRRKRA